MLKCAGFAPIIFSPIVCSGKRFYTRETKRGISVSPLAEILPFSKLAEMIELRKGLIILVGLKGRGV